MYVNMKNLINFLAKFDPKNESIYVGYPGNGWLQPHNLNSKQKIFKGKKKLNCHFSLGAMYCISRPLVEEMKPWLGSRSTLRETCEKLSDPDDVTIGCSIEYFTTKRLTRTHLILPHTINLSKFNNLQKYVGIGYGCGQRCKKGDKTMNAVVVPNAKFSTKDDPTRFKSLHCHLHPHATLCVS
jgi:fringe protein